MACDEMIDQQEIDILTSSLQRLSEGFKDLPPFDTSLDAARIREVMDDDETLRLNAGLGRLDIEPQIDIEPQTLYIEPQTL